MSHTKKTLLLIVTALVLVLSACGPSETPQPAPTAVDLDAYATQVARDVIAQITQTAAAAPTSTPDFTPTPEVTSTPENSPTPEITATQGDCDNAAYVSDISIPDGTTINSGAEFVKTWRIQNTGTCTWKTSYRLIYAYPANGPFAAAAANLGQEVAPGQSVDISVTLKAPTTKGTYTGAWRMINNNGYAFGDFVTVSIAVP